MPISRLVSMWTLGCATLGSLALLANHAGAAPTADHGQGARDRVDAGDSWQARAADSSRGIVRASTIDDRFQSDEARDARGKHEAFPAKRRGHRGGGHGPVTPSSPIPEPGSMMLFAAGLGLVGLFAWRKGKNALAPVRSPFAGGPPQS